MDATAQSHGIAAGTSSGAETKFKHPKLFKPQTRILKHGCLQAFQPGAFSIKLNQELPEYIFIPRVRTDLFPSTYRYVLNGIGVASSVYLTG